MIHDTVKVSRRRAWLKIMEIQSIYLAVSKKNFAQARITVHICRSSYGGNMCTYSIYICD